MESAGENNIGSATSLVLCENVAVAQAVIRGLALHHARAVQLPGHFALPPYSWSGNPPRLTIVIASDGAVIAAACRALKRRWTHTKIVIAGVPNHEDAILDAYAAGADGIVLAGESLARLGRVVHDTVANKFSPPPQILRPVFDRLVRLQLVGEVVGQRLPVVRLSTRELEILRYLERGESNKVIASQLNVELQTVKNHVTHVLHKLGVRSRYDAGRFAAQHLLGRSEPEKLGRERTEK